MHGIIRRSSTFNTSRIDHIYRDRHEVCFDFSQIFQELINNAFILLRPVSSCSCTTETCLILQIYSILFLKLSPMKYTTLVPCLMSR